MGTRGTQFLLDHFEYSRGDAMITGDAGSPRGVAVWGKRHALARDRGARQGGARGARSSRCKCGGAPDKGSRRGLRASRNAGAHPLQTWMRSSGPRRGFRRQSQVMARRTLFGTSRSTAVSSAAARFQTSCLTRPTPRSISGFRPETTSADVEAGDFAGILAAHEGVNYRIIRRYEPQWSDPHHELVSLLAKAGEEILGRRPVANYRVGASDARLYRQRGVRRLCLWSHSEQHGRCGRVRGCGRAIRGGLHAHVGRI